MKTKPEVLLGAVAILCLGLLGCGSTGKKIEVIDPGPQPGVEAQPVDSPPNSPKVEEIAPVEKPVKPVAEFRSEAPQPKAEVETAVAETPKTEPVEASPAPVPPVEPPPPPPPPPVSEAKPAERPPPPPEPSVTEIKPLPKPSPATAYSGRIMLINPVKKFAIIDFAEGKIPPMRSELGIYRGTLFVGSVRLTPPVRGSLVSADILTGTPRRGDEVR